ncbi:MAG TPA: hypothetical protein VL337_08985 [Acidimicrobiales bacterium]|jgi:hypothetical protein|nr:hypothetical protein [Acidimicrobiales bacterium]
MTDGQTLDHEALLTLARKAEAAATDGDRDRLRAAAQRLSVALVDHVRAERSCLENLPATDGRLLERGQERVFGLLTDLMNEAGRSGECRCVRLARRLSAQLSVQANQERAAGVGPQPVSLL